ncbi:MAG TPA: hypothetical protein VLI39_00875 [Sedimentisphaerales bacterium]|nr:hypothetical protein [Sedimentisphaerales bacterium]
MELSDDLREKLEEAALKATDNFCYGCYQVVEDDVCPKCGSDDFMRHLDGVGVEYGTEWVIEHLIQEHCEPIDEEEAYEDLLNECYEQIDICGMKYDPGYALKTIDPVAFRCGVSDMLADSDTYVEADGRYYLVSDIEAMIEELN